MRAHQSNATGVGGTRRYSVISPLALVGATVLAFGLVATGPTPDAMAATADCGPGPITQIDPNAGGTWRGTYTNCTSKPVSKRMQLDRGGDSKCYTLPADQTSTETFSPRWVAYPGGARWVDCSAP